MAVTFDADGEKSETPSAWDYNAAYTVALWVRPESVNAAFHQVLAVQAADSSANIDDLYISSGNVWTVRALIASAGTGQTGSTPSANTWYHLTMVRSSTQLLNLYVNGVANAGPSTQDVTGRTAATKMALGLSTWATTNELNGRIAHVKVWTAALSTAEMVNEMNSVRPVRWTNLWAWYPIIAGDRTLDWSGNGRSLTETGSVTTSDDPGITFGGSILYPMQPLTGGDGELDHILLRRNTRRMRMAG